MQAGHYHPANEVMAFRSANVPHNFFAVKRLIPQGYLRGHRFKAIVNHTALK